jgi:CRP/FNR family cyclic AMP-dependent transcriptional regulator
MSTSYAAAQDRLFDALTPSVRALALQGCVRSFRKNTVIITEGETGDSTYVLLAGRVRVYSNDSAGHELTFGVVEPGDYFAEMWLDGGTRSASIITLEPCVCSVIAVPICGTTWRPIPTSPSN